eukprot:2928072-Alexandrium_andersonii.AAC.1
MLVLWCQLRFVADSAIADCQEGDHRGLNPSRYPPTSVCTSVAALLGVAAMLAAYCVVCTLVA